MIDDPSIQPIASYCSCCCCCCLCSDGAVDADAATVEEAPVDAEAAFG